MQVKQMRKGKPLGDQAIDAKRIRAIGVSGLYPAMGPTDADGNPISGDAALTELKSGPWSSFLQSAVLQAYFEQFGEARVKNSKPSRGR